MIRDDFSILHHMFLWFEISKQTLLSQRNITETLASGIKFSPDIKSPLHRGSINLLSWDKMFPLLTKITSSRILLTRPFLKCSAQRSWQELPSGKRTARVESSLTDAQSMNHFNPSGDRHGSHSTVCGWVSVRHEDCFPTNRNFFYLSIYPIKKTTAS